jgi:hypothetical protein
MTKFKRVREDLGLTGNIFYAKEVEVDILSYLGHAVENARSMREGHRSSLARAGASQNFLFDINIGKA